MNYRFTYIPFTAAISGPDYAAADEPLYFYADIISPGVEPYSYYWTCSNGSPSTDSYYQVNMITSGVGVNLLITDASNNNAGDYQFVNWNGLYNLMAEPNSKTQSDDEIGNIFPNPTPDYFEFNFKGAKKNSL